MQTESAEQALRQLEGLRSLGFDELDVLDLVSALAAGEILWNDIVVLRKKVLKKGEPLSLVARILT